MAEKSLPEIMERFLTEKLNLQVNSEPLSLLVGVSGGPDSLALLYLLQGLTLFKGGVKIRVAHLNHLIRGASAVADADFVRETCEKFGLEYHQAEFRVKTFAKENSLSLEEGARRARYTFFASILSKFNIPVLLLGHNADDQAETLLLRLLRGTGPQGLGGMAPVSALPPPDPRLKALFPYDPELISKVKLGRPLLGVWRNDIEKYCAINNLDPRRDETNLEPGYTRNRVRNELIPYLEKEFKPFQRKGLIQLSRLVRSEQEWLDRLTGEAFAAHAIISNNSKVEFARAYFEAQPLALQRRLLRRAYFQLSGTLENLESRGIEEIISTPHLTSHLPGGFTGFSNSKKIGIRRTKISKILPLIPRALSLPGEVVGPDWILKAKVLDRAKISDEEIKKLGKNEAFLDLDLTGFSFIIRSRKPGDKFQPLGSPGRRKIQDIMLDTGIERDFRSVWPLVVATFQERKPEAIVWLPGIATPQRYKVTPQTQKILHLLFFRDRKENQG